MLPDGIKQLIDDGALFLVNHSGGKDSQAMAIYLQSIVPAAQLIVVHAHLPGVEWDGVREHIQDTIGTLPYYEVKANKTFFDMVRHRKMWPSSNTRQCTSDLKRGPIEKLLRDLCKNMGFTRVVNCMGIRSQESAARSKKSPFTVNARQSVAGRKVYNWYPIFDKSVEWVWSAIAAAGQKGHFAYDAGMTRLSCCFCIMSSQSDLCTAARLMPKLLDQIVAIEKEIGHTFVAPKKGQDPVNLDVYISSLKK